jgi:hypothetical protein
MKTILVSFSGACALLAIVLVAPLLARTDMSANMVAAWELEADGTDSVGSNTLTVNNAPSFVAAKQGNGADLELGSTQYLSLADNAALSLSTDTAASLSVWFYMESAAVAMTVVSKAAEYSLFIDAGFAQFGVVDGTAYNAIAEVAAGSTATWYHACGRHDATNDLVKLRINGSADNTEATNPNGSHDGTGAFNIGAENNTFHFDGIVDQVILWKRYLSDAECDELYNSGSGVTLASITGGGGGGASPHKRRKLMGVGLRH